MKKVIAWILVLALTAAISIGVTLAFLTDTDEDVNVMTLGNVKIDQLEFERKDVETEKEKAEVQRFHNNKALYPAVTENGFDYTTGDSYVDWQQIGKDGYSSEIWDPSKINNELDKMVFVKNKGDFDAYVRSVFAFEANGHDLAQFKELFHLNINETDWTWEWEAAPVAIPNADGSETTNYVIATATYNKVLKPGAFTEISLSQIALDSSVSNEALKGFGDTYQVLVKTQAIQADGFSDQLLPEYENAKTALDAGFGPVTYNLPFENDNSFRGIDLRTALHNLEGDTSRVITTKVTNVVFDLNERHPEIVDHYKGTLVDVEQDVPVYAYYVDSDGSYTVYFLADDTIYSPTNSSYLFANMSALTKVDTTNFDVSRVENMRRMFGGDSNLAEIDVGDWDTSSVTSMNGTFFNCQSLQSLDVSNWDLGVVTDMYAMFYYCKTLPELDVSNWQVGNVTNMEFTFSGCEKFVTLDVANWDVSKVLSLDAFFQSARKTYTAMQLETLDVSKWDISSCKNLNRMFYGCGKLRFLDMSSWNTENVEDLTSMFFNCKELTTLYASEKWNTERFTQIDGAFVGCSKLVGGNGTAYSTVAVSTAAYARIDTDETPGYLTYKACG